MVLLLSLEPVKDLPFQTVLYECINHVSSTLGFSDYVKFALP